MTTIDLHVTIAADHSQPLHLATPVVGASGWIDIDSSSSSLFGACLSPLATMDRRRDAHVGWVETASGIVMNPASKTVAAGDLMRLLGQRDRQRGPLIAALDASLADLTNVIARITDQDLADAVEIDVRALSPDAIAEVVAEAAALPTLPLLARVERDPEIDVIAEHLRDHRIAAIVADGAPLATAIDRRGVPVRGRLYGPAVRPMTLELVAQLRAVSDLPIIAAGGIFHVDDVMAAARIGAVAVEIDLLHAIHPARSDALASDLSRCLERAGYRTWSDLIAE